MSDRTTPRYSPAEEVCNSATHVAGAVLTVFGTYLLVRSSSSQSFVVSALIYGVAIFSMFLTSSIYHAVREPRVKGAVRKVDHAMIYFTIAGTYVPILNAISSTREAVIWYCGLGLCAVAGAVFSFVTLKHKYITTTIYLVMGWASLLLLRNIWRGSEPATAYLLVAGGVVYSIGAALDLIRKPFMHAVFHVFVVGGVVLQYLAIRMLYV